MRLTVSLAGFELDVTLGRETQDADDDVSHTDRGYLTSYPVGFVRDPDVPWEDRGSLHQFDPEPDSEDV